MPSGVVSWRNRLPGLSYERAAMAAKALYSEITMRQLSNSRTSLSMRLAWFGTVALAVLIGWSAAIGPAGPLRAQEGGEADVPAAAAEAEQARPASNAPADDAPPKSESVLKWFVRALGITYTTVFLAISLVFVALLVMCILNARRENVLPSDLVAGFEAHLGEKRYQEAYELARSDESFLGQVLAAGLAKINLGYPKAIEPMAEECDDAI